MVERSEAPRVPAWGEGPGVVALAGLLGLALAAFWFAGVPRLEARPAASTALPASGEVHLGGETWVPLADPVIVQRVGMRLVGRSNEGYLVYAAGGADPAEAHRPLLGGGGGWVPPSGVPAWDPPRDRLFLAAPDGRWLPLRRRLGN